MDDQNTRRQFLKKMGATLAGAAGVPLEALFDGAFAAPTRKGKVGAKTKPQAALQAKKPLSVPPGKYKLAPWTGDDFTIGHRFRNGELPGEFPATPDKTVEFVIVGGGIAGLTSAYYLKDHDFLLLEQYDELGGQSRGGTFQGIDYSWGPAFIGTIDGIYGQLYGDLGITPVKLPPGNDAFYWDKHWITGTQGKQQNALYQSFKQFQASTASMMSKLPADDTPAAIDTPDLSKLDGMPFSELLKGQSAAFQSIIQSICKSGSTGTPEQISALAGLYLMGDLTCTNYVFKGGNPAIARALVQKLKDGGASRLQSGTFVWQVILKEGGAEILYTSADGSMHRVACKHVILATPPMVAWRQTPKMDDRMKANLMPMKYGSFLVANCLLRKKTFNSLYDNWFGTPFEFSDLIVAETPYILDRTYKPEMGSVLTIYHPWEPGSSGRTLLLTGKREDFAKPMYDQMYGLVESLEKNLQEVVLSRWGHAMVVPGVNYFARLRKIMAAYTDTTPYTLAHNSTQGLPCAESAIRAAKFASARALKCAASPTMVVPKMLN